MDRPETRDGHHSRTLGCEQAAPMAVRMLLGARLRKLRESVGVSREADGSACARRLPARPLYGQVDQRDRRRRVVLATA